MKNDEAKSKENWSNPETGTTEDYKSSGHKQDACQEAARQFVELAKEFRKKWEQEEVGSLLDEYRHIEELHRTNETDEWQSAGFSAQVIFALIAANWVILTTFKPGLLAKLLILTSIFVSIVYLFIRVKRQQLNVDHNRYIASFCWEAYERGESCPIRDFGSERSEFGKSSDKLLPWEKRSMKCAAFLFLIAGAEVILTQMIPELISYFLIFWASLKNSF